MLLGLSYVFVAVLGGWIVMEVVRVVIKTDFYDPVSIFIGMFLGALIWVAFLISWR